MTEPKDLVDFFDLLVEEAKHTPGPFVEYGGFVGEAKCSKTWKWPNEGYCKIFVRYDNEPFAAVNRSLLAKIDEIGNGEREQSKFQIEKIVAHEARIEDQDARIADLERQIAVLSDEQRRLLAKVEALEADCELPVGKRQRTDQ